MAGDNAGFAGAGVKIWAVMPLCRITPYCLFAALIGLVSCSQVPNLPDPQMARIERGFHRGAITRWEFRRLMAEHQDIDAMKRAFIADGFLGPRERMELNRRLDIASSHIFFEAHDGQRRF